MSRTLEAFRQALHTYEVPYRDEDALWQIFDRYVCDVIDRELEHSIHRPILSVTGSYTKNIHLVEFELSEVVDFDSYVKKKLIDIYCLDQIATGFYEGWRINLSSEEIPDSYFRWHLPNFAGNSYYNNYCQQAGMFRAAVQSTRADLVWELRDKGCTTYRIEPFAGFKYAHFYRENGDIVPLTRDYADHASSASFSQRIVERSRLKKLNALLDA